MTEQQQVATVQEKRPIDVIKDTLLKNDSLQSVLPKHIEKDRFVRIAVASISANPALLECNRPSLYNAVLTAAQLGLVTDQQLGQAYIVPYKGKAQLQVGYKGLLLLARQSGEISTVTMEAVYENDKFEYELGDEARISHKPVLSNRGKPIGYYAIVKMKDGGIMREFMSDSDVEKIRVRSPSANSPAWKDSREEMGKKTVFRRLAKKLPLSADRASEKLQQAIAMEEKIESVNADLVVDNTAAEPKPRAKRTPKEKLAEFNQTQNTPATEADFEEVAASDGDVEVEFDLKTDEIIPAFLRSRAE